MLTDVVDNLCWWQLWYFDDILEIQNVILIIQPPTVPNSVESFFSSKNFDLTKIQIVSNKWQVKSLNLMQILFFAKNNSYYGGINWIMSEYFKRKTIQFVFFWYTTEQFKWIYSEFAENRNSHVILIWTILYRLYLHVFILSYTVV